MSWARLDDRFHDHPKVIAAGLDGAGLFTLCLTWAHQARRTSPTPGVVPAAVVVRFAGPKGRRLAAKLQEVGLFDDTTPAGYPIHDFAEYLPRYDADQAKAAGSAGGKARAAAAHRRRQASEPLGEPPADDEAVGEQTGKRIQARAGTGAPRRRNPVPVPEPEPADVAGAPSVRGSSSRGGPSGTRARPAGRCERHRDTPAGGPCAPCGDARRDQQAFDQARRDATPPTFVPCPEHPEHPAGRCGVCAATATPMPPGWRAAS